MFLLRLLGLVFILIPTTLAAQIPSEIPESPIQAGGKALLFQVPSLSLSAFGGATISAKWHPSATAARRASLTVAADLSTAEDRGRQNANFDFDLLFLKYSRTRTPVYLYHGLGPTAMFRINRQTIEDGPSLTIFQSGLGVGAVLGVEWIVAPAIGLVGEYISSLFLTYSRRPTSSDETVGEYGVTLQARGARAGISVYF